VAEEFLKPVHRGMILVEQAPEDALRAMKAYRPPPVPKLIARDQR
jgi:hypothetical protein